MTRSRLSPVYGNCIIEAPDGQPLCRTNKDRINWYLERNLGEVVSEDPKTLRLFFEPKGRNGADHPYTTAFKDNVCVVCGTDNDITRHHVVPKCFRKYFPEKRKTHAVHDVLVMCIKCHNDYEIEAYKLKLKICEEFGVSILGDVSHLDRSYFNVRTAGNALFKSYNKIPLVRREELLDKLRDFFGKKEITEEDIKYAAEYRPANYENKPFGQIVVERLENIDDFVLKWRKHFIYVMKPEYLPAYWDVYNQLA